MPTQEQEFVATRIFRAGGDNFVQDFERGEVVPLDKITDGWILKETGDVVLSNSDEGLRAVADYDKYHTASDEEADATDAAERKAEELGINLEEVEGTGKDGRITAGDVERHAEAQ